MDQSVSMTDSMNGCHAIVVPGEAPETDDEDDAETANVLPSGIVNNNFEPGDLKERTPRRGRTSAVSSTPPSALPYVSNSTLKYDSLNHRKLRDNQMALGKQASEFYHRHCMGVSKEVGAISQAIHSVQTSLQESSFRMREVADCLYKINDQIETVLSYNMLPDFKSERLSNSFPCIDSLSKT